MCVVARKYRSKSNDEPGIEPGDDWVEYGGELILAAGFTENGVPHGTTVHEFRESNARKFLRAGWARAERAIERVVGAVAGHDVEVGFVKFVNSGLSRAAFRAEVDRWASSVYALVPNVGAEQGYHQRALGELRLLQALNARRLPFRVPRALGALRDDGGLILVEDALSGVPLDLRAGSQGNVQPWKEIGWVAAAIHSLPLAELPAGLFNSVDCRSYAESQARSVTGDDAELRDARDWMLEHLPPAEPGVLLHGDLLGQNVFLGIDETVGVIDWERAEVGDPAYDLAVVTRGARKPFQHPNGLARLLEEYAAAGGRTFAPSRVWFYELGILASQYKAALLAQRGDVLGARQRLRSILTRLESPAPAQGS